ncbi:hypothetical protein AMTR_s00105p00045800 [Amborella trichopoda]|uniref:Myb/SANT-like domain-containing protein n=1 Tax=Amborella trichopoda TaxID=13333 RepID=W1NZ93_AMBTC|nr:hypothetical protein AMTR_s00105p00045800 [Amborella trichopoda]
MNVSGFGWDARRRIVTVDSAVWIDYLAENEWANKYHNKMLPEYSLLSKIYVGNTADGMYKSTEGGITIESERPETPFSNDPLVEVQQPTSNYSMTKVMIEVIDNIKMLAREIAGNSSTLVVDVPSKVRRDALKTVEDMWRAGELGDDVFVTAARIFQDSIKAEMLLNLPDPRILKAYLDEEVKHL